MALSSDAQSSSGLTQSGQSPQSEPNRAYLRLKRWVAIAALINLALVFFDLTYLSLRPIYWQFVPHLVQVYDPVKGIMPHPETQRYGAQVAALAAQLGQTSVQSAVESAVESAEVESLLAQLQSDGQRLVQDDPFPGQDNGTLETIQQLLLERTGADSTLVAFDRFWSQDYLAEAGWQAELSFWNQQINPLIVSNYYRRVNRFGQPIDYFWLLDLPFMLLFAADFAVRDRAIRRRSPRLSWLESLLRRWYDLFLILPFARWLRLIPVTLRLHQVHLINLTPLEAEFQRDFAIGFAQEVVKVVGLQAIDQLQEAIRSGAVMQWLLYPELRREYVEVGNRNEIEAIVTHTADLVIRQVLPQIQPDLEMLIQYFLHHVFFDQLPGYQRLQFLPGVGRLPRQTTERLTKNFSRQTYESLLQIWDDPEIGEIKDQLVHSFVGALAVELQKKHNTQEIEDLLIDMLEEIKINYVRSISGIRIARIVDEAEQIRRSVKN